MIAAAMTDAGVDPDIRAERVTPEQFIRMSEYIAANMPNPPETHQDEDSSEESDAAQSAD